MFSSPKSLHTFLVQVELELSSATETDTTFFFRATCKYSNFIYTRLKPLEDRSQEIGVLYNVTSLVVDLSVKS